MLHSPCRPTALAQARAGTTGLIAAGSSECTEELLGQGKHPSALNFQTVIPHPDALFQYDRNAS